MTRTTGYRMLLATLIGVAGTVMPASAQQDLTRDRDGARAPAATEGYDFRSASWLKDRDVVNTNGDEVASVSDLIINRGSGTIDYAVVSTGTILGMGGRRVALTYDALRWDDANDRFVLPLTSEQLEQYPEFSEDAWKALADRGDAPAKSLRERLTTDSRSSSRDPYADSLEGATNIRVAGEVTRVERRSYGESGEHVVVTVRTDDGNTRRVALGPSWFVNSGAHAPMRGDKVTIEAVALPRDPDKILVARTLRAGDRDIVLRDERGAPSWVAATNNDGDADNNVGRRHLLLSALEGADVTCRGLDCGAIDDVVIERRSGGLAFLSIDPDENFLGIADTKRLVPWTVASVAADGSVRIDASKEMVLASPETPDELTTMNSGGVMNMVYKSYEVDPPRFEARRARADRSDALAPMVDADAWTHSGPIFKALKKDSLKTMTGKHGNVRQVKLGDGVAPASAMVFNNGTEDVLVLLGPAWYMEKQALPCKADEQVRVEAYRTTIGGKDYWIAKSIECGGARTELMTDSGAPVWDRK